MLAAETAWPCSPTLLVIPPGLPTKLSKKCVQPPTPVSWVCTPFLYTSSEGRRAEAHLVGPEHPGDEHQGEPGEHHGQHVDRPLLGDDRRVEHGQAGEAHQADERGGGYLPRVVRRIEPTGIRNVRCCSYQVDHSSSPNCHACLLPSSPAETPQNAGYGKATSDGSPRRRHDAGQGFPHRHACVSSVLIHLGSRHDPGLIGTAPGEPHYAHRYRLRSHRHQTASAERPPSSATRGRAAADHPHGDPTRLGTLRGAGVEVDVRTVGAGRHWHSCWSLAVLVVVLTIAGVHNNQQIDRLHTTGRGRHCHRVRLPGPAGRERQQRRRLLVPGPYTLSGHSYNERSRAPRFYRPGPTMAAVAVPGDPALVSPAPSCGTEHSSWRVFILPAVLWWSSWWLSRGSGVVASAAVPGDDPGAEGPDDRARRAAPAASELEPAFCAGLGWPGA